MINSYLKCVLLYGICRIVCDKGHKLKYSKSFHGLNLRLRTLETMSHKLSLLAVFVLCFHHGIDGFRDTSLSFDNGNFNVSWMHNRAREELYFEVTVKTKGWVGFGFTFTPHNMSNYDIIIGGQTRRGKPYFNVSYFKAASSL